MAVNYCILYFKNHLNLRKVEMLMKANGIDVLTVKSLSGLKDELSAQQNKPMFLFMEIDNFTEDIVRIAGVKVIVGRLPILVLGNEPKRDFLMEVMMAGAADFLVKPLDDGLAMEKITKVLKKQMDEGPHITPAVRDMLRSEIAKARKGRYDLSIGLITLSLPHESYEIAMEQRLRKDLPLLFDHLGTHLFETDLKMTVGIQSILVILPFCSNEQRPIFAQKIQSRFVQFQQEHPFAKSYTLTQHYLSDFEESAKPEHLFSTLVNMGRKSPAPQPSR